MSAEVCSLQFENEGGGGSDGIFDEAFMAPPIRHCPRLDHQVNSPPEERNHKKQRDCQLRLPTRRDVIYRSSLSSRGMVSAATTLMDPYSNDEKRPARRQ